MRNKSYIGPSPDLFVKKTGLYKNTHPIIVLRKTCTIFYIFITSPILLTVIKVAVIFIFCSILFCSRLQAQRGYTAADSSIIYHWLDKADSDDLKGNADSAFYDVNQALQYSRKKHMRRGEGFALLKLADLTSKKEGATQVLKMLDEPLRIARKLNDSFMIALSHHQTGQVLLNQNKYADARAAYAKALPYYSMQSHADYRAMLLNESGFISDKMGEYDQSAGYYLEAIRMFEKENNLKELANSTGNLAISNFRAGNKEEAIKLFKRSAQIRENIGDAKGLASTYGNLVVVYTPISVDSAVKYQQLVLAYANKSGAKNNIAQANATAAMLLSKQKKYSEAIAYQQKAIELYSETGDRLKLANQYSGMANLYHYSGDSVKAAAYFEKASELAAALNNKPLFQNLYTQQASFYTERDDYRQAYRFFKLSQQYKDSIMNEKTATNIAELQTKYETEKKDNEISKLQTEQKINQLEIEQQQAKIRGDAVLAKQKQTEITLLKQQQQLRDEALLRQKEELEKQSLVAKNNEQQLLLSVQNLQIAENEKKIQIKQLDKERLLRNGLVVGILLLGIFAVLLLNRYKLRKKIEEQKRLMEVRNKISRDLHDEIGSTLTSINILSSVSEQAIDGDPVQARQMLHQITTQSKTVQQNMSDIVWAIRPDNEKLENLLARMREFIGQTLEPQQIQATLQTDDKSLQLLLPMDMRKELLLLYKEAMNNILKHSGATAVAVKMSVQGKALLLQIDDNGSWKQNPQSSGTGTYSMKQRAAAMNGTITINGTASGTSVSLRVPIP